MVICMFVVALDTDITSWGGTIVTPGQPAYSKEEHKKEEMGEEEGQEESQEGQEGQEGGEEEAEEKMETS